jgi:hypothetical protein
MVIDVTKKKADKEKNAGYHFDHEGNNLVQILQNCVENVMICVIL